MRKPKPNGQQTLYDQGRPLNMPEVWALARVKHAMFWGSTCVAAEVILDQPLRVLIDAAEAGELCLALRKRDPEVDGVRIHYGGHDGPANHID